MNISKKITNVIFIILVCVMFTGCSTTTSSEPKENNKKEQIEATDTYEVDYLKISPMIVDNVEKNVVDAALHVMEAFLNYENTASISISGNQTRFLNDMGYVINCTCPLFCALTDYNEMTSYDAENEVVSWEFFVTQDEFQKTVTEFTKTVEEYLSVVDKKDSDSMKAILLYCKLVENASYDYEILGDAYETMNQTEYCMRESSYHVLVNKKGICTNLSQALMFLYTQADLTSGTVLHQGGTGAHMWSIVKIDDKYYYCDPTWDVGASPKTFGITSDDRSSWAGEYAKGEGTMLSAIVDQKYEINDGRFSTLRQKTPVEITEIKVNKDEQTITFVGYDYEYTFDCKE